MQALGVLTGITLRLANIAPAVATGLLLTPLATMSAAGIYLYITAADKRRPALIQAMPPGGCWHLLRWRLPTSNPPQP